MFTIEELMEITREICEEYNIPLPGIIRYNARLSATLGRCLIPRDGINPPIIELNKGFCEINRDEIIIGVLKHELAHLVHFNHGPEFAGLCKKMGIKVHTDESFSDIKYQRPNYTYQCPMCKIIFHRTQKFKSTVSCAECNEKKKYNKKYELVLIDQS